MQNILREIRRTFMFWLTAGVTGKGGNWREKPPDAESAVGARYAVPESVGKARTCPVQVLLARF